MHDARIPSQCGTLLIDLPPGRTCKLLQLTDTHLSCPPGRVIKGLLTNDSFRAVLAQARLDSDWPPDLILLTGDLAEDPACATYEWLAERLEETGIPCAALPGNHDAPETMRHCLERKQLCMPRLVAAGDWRIICLNSQVQHQVGGRLTEEELEALATCLEAAGPAQVLVAVHHPPIRVGSAWIDALGLENGDLLLHRLHRHPTARAVLFGHIHHPVDVSDGGLRVLGSPSTCYQFALATDSFAIDPLPPGYRWLRLGPDGQIDTRVERLVV